MIKSIRTFLLVNLFLCVTLITSLAVIGNLFLEHRRFQGHLDSQLSMAAFIIQAFLDESSDLNTIQQIQAKINDIPEELIAFKKAHVISQVASIMKSIQFQVWDRRSKLLLHSYTSQAVPQKAEGSIGFSTVWHANKPWRMFTLYSPGSGFRIVVLQRLAIRTQLEKQITRDSVLMMILVYPFLGLLTWVIVGQGLSSITNTAEQLKRRSNPNSLTPINSSFLPKELKPLVNELNNLFDRLSKAFFREKRFAADAAHELRTPLSGISLQAQVALGASSEKERTHALNQMIRAVKNSSHVIEQLLTLSRMMPEASINEPKKINLALLVADSCYELALAAKVKHITLKQGPYQGDFRILGNDTAISILLRNILDNAIRYSSPHTTVEVKLMEQNKYVILEVVDQGQGISAEQRERVFDRFYRIVDAKETGSGLGLGIVKQIADLHEAKIFLDNNPKGQGLSFKVQFPRQFYAQ
jgi:two-component system, OmpR family, sensor histidine kinase QseC